MSETVTVKQLDKTLDIFGTKLFKYLGTRFDEVNERIDKIEVSFDRLQQTLDGFIKRLDDLEMENTARDAQLARLERWIEQVARKSGVKLEY